MLDVYGAAALLRSFAYTTSPRPPVGRVSIRSRIGDKPPVGQVSIRSRIGDKHPAGRMRIGASRLTTSNANTFVRARAYGLFQPRVSGPSRGACAPWDGPSTLG